MGATVLEYDAVAAGGLAPDELAFDAWTRFGTPMQHTGSFLLQDNTFDDPITQSGEYRSPATPGLMNLNSGQYGVEFKARPLTDVPFLGSSHYSNAYVFWSDDQFAYNITIDKDTDDNGPGTTGGIRYGQNSMSNAVTGIDWSTAHGVYIGYRSSAPFGVFDFYVDGVIKTTVSAGSMARSAGFPFAQNAVDFGDGTTGQGIDIGVEWYRVALHDTASPIVAPSAWNNPIGGNWSVPANWTNGVPNSLTGTATATFGSVITSPQTVTLDTPQTIGHVVFDSAQSYTIAGPGTLTFSVAGTSSIDVLLGSHVISAPVIATSATNITVAGGSTLAMTGSSIGSAPNATVSKNGDGTLQLTHFRGHRLQINVGNTTIIPGATAQSASGASNVKDLLIDGGTAPVAVLDLTNNAIVVDYDTSSPASALVAQLISGRAGGAWNGLGINSSTAAATVGRALGYAEASSLGLTTFADQPVDATSFIIAYTVAGDANLDKTVNLDDFTRLAAGFGASGAWSQGDFNYDGAVNLDDFTTLAAAFGTSVTGELPRNSVPEPTTGLLGIATAGLFAARRRHR